MDRVLFIRSLVDRYFDCSYFLPVRNTAALNTCVLLLCGQIFSLLWCMCFGGELLLSKVLQWVTHTHDVTPETSGFRFRGSRSVLHSHQPWMRAQLLQSCQHLLLSVPFLTVTLVGVKDCLTLVLICISLVAGHVTPWPFLYIHWMHVYSGPLPVF